jgi:hypothetical protein
VGVDADSVAAGVELEVELVVVEVEFVVAEAEVVVAVVVISPPIVKVRSF